MIIFSVRGCAGYGSGHDARENTVNSEKFNSALKRWKKVIGEVIYGLTRHEFEIQMRKAKGDLEDLFLLMSYGDMVGLPVIPPYYTLRLLPYIVPTTQRWKTRLLRERDLTEFVAGDL